MRLDPFSEIELAGKSHTANEQKEHILAVKESLGYFLKQEKPIANLHDMYEKVEKIEKALEKSKDPVQLSPDLIEQIKALSEQPIVKRSVEKRPPVQKNCWTLFDYTN
ncbi:hypothetical protein NEMIN01_1210 [Nematocida minor]|uniref:uncharacterized protein n=1 Tax=Nematocida minor TaxID=1912983 RepID=UPI00222115F1|nr:uncharacterized protein NEMIN01_1210 [Nematocida minor]KAI5190808.1 hypothetical protein NEMIN01_1210 [Nematocida minor]